MLRVDIAHARPGMVLAMPIFHPQRADTVLLRPGFALDDRAIGRLRDQKLRELWIRYPGLEFIGESVDPDLSVARGGITGQVGEALEAAMADAHAPLDYLAYKRAISGLIERLVKNPKASLFMEEMSGAGGTLAERGANVSFLSVLMGLRLEGYLVRERSRLHASSARDVAPLGVGAMLHDIGMTRIDPEARERWERTADESDPAWRRHVLDGYKLVQGQIEPAAAAVVLHHHQHYDGSGFPRRRGHGPEPVAMSGSQIHVFARIGAGAELFDRQLHPVTGGHVPVVRALRAILDPPLADRLDPFVRLALVTVVPPFAPGTTVGLSNGRSAVVTRWEPSEPCRPTVRLLKAGDPLQGLDEETDPIDLRDATDLSVTFADGDDVSADVFFSDEFGPFDLSRSIQALTNQAIELEDAEQARRKAG